MNINIEKNENKYFKWIIKNNFNKKNILILVTN